MYLPGVDMEFEIPENPNLILDPKEKEKNIETLVDFLSANRIYPVQ